MKIALGTDHAGYPYKERIKRFLLENGHQVEDFGTHSEVPVDYPVFVRPAAGSVAGGECERGIVLGGSGNGEAMAANRVPGVRCALCWNRETALLARRHNDANVLSLGARVVPWEQAEEIVRVWLETPFDGGRHLRRIRQIDEPVPSPGDAGEEGQGARRPDPRDSTEAREGGYDVLVSFGYILYSEGKRSIELIVEPGLKHPTIIRVPTVSRWDEEMPEWARGRREEILSRIRPKCAHLDCKFEDF